MAFSTVQKKHDSGQESCLNSKKVQINLDIVDIWPKA